MSSIKLLLFNKPFKVLCQFSDDRNRDNLSNYINIKDIYSAGRLDFDSEGLLVITNSGRLRDRITHPKHKLLKKYWVQVDGIPTTQAINTLCNGIALKDGKTLPALVKLIPEPKLWPRNPPIRYRANIPTQWLEIGLREGRNRQIRRMTAAIGYPTLRLVRVSIGPWQLDELQPGESKTVSVDIKQLSQYTK